MDPPSDLETTPLLTRSPTPKADQSALCGCSGERETDVAALFCGQLMSGHVIVQRFLYFGLPGDTRWLCGWRSHPGPFGITEKSSDRIGGPIGLRNGRRPLAFLLADGADVSETGAGVDRGKGGVVAPPVVSRSQIICRWSLLNSASTSGVSGDPLA
jgi:hypothetical protein